MSVEVRRDLTHDTPREIGAMYSQSFVDELIAWADGAGIATPALAVAPPVLRAGVDHLRKGLGGRVSYSTKANPHPEVLRTLDPLVDEFNVTNVVQLDQLLDMGVDPARIAWLHPVPSPATLEAVAARGIRRFVVDDARNLALLQATGLGAETAVTLRCRPPRTGEAERSVVRFGAPADVVVELGRQVVDAGLRLEALSFFVGTETSGPEHATPYLDGIATLVEVHDRLAAEAIAVPTVNVGGGFPGCRRRFHHDHPDFFERIRAALVAGLGPDVDIVSEPGRYLAESSMVMFTRVIADRTVAGRRCVHVDASSYGGLFESTFIAPSADALCIGAASDAGPAVPGELIGPIMDSYDVLQKGGRVPVVPERGLLVLGQVGAYSIGFTTHSEGVAPPAVVVLPDDLAEAMATEWTS